MKSVGFDDEELALIVDDAIKHHSCHGSSRPASIEGEILATADALAHLQSSFYAYAFWVMNNQPLEQVMRWASEKLDRDFHNKICFDDVREAARTDYEALKRVFG